MQARRHFTGLARFRRAQHGSVAVEFALLALPFFALLFAIIETTIIFFASVSLDTGVAEMARLVRTGQVQLEGLGEDEIRTTVCDAIFMGCDERLRIDVRRFDGFADVDFADPLDEEGDLRADFAFDPGGPGDIVLVRAFYVWTVTTPLLGAGMANMSGGSRLLASSAALRNEPFNEP